MAASTPNTHHLRTLYASAERQLQLLEKTTTAHDGADLGKIRELLHVLEGCQALVEQSALFSNNEGVDDVATGDLPYLLIEYHIAELVSRLSTPNRNAALTVAQVSYEKYLRGLQAYDVLSDQDQKMYDQYLENPQTFSTASTTDLAARRQAKIERFRREKEWKQKLEHLQRMPDALRDDESRVRDLHLMRIRLSTHQAFASLESIAQELHVRSLAASYTAPAEPGQAGDDRVRVRLGGGGGDYSERVDPPLAQLLAAGGRGPMLDGEGRPLQPFTLLDKRDQLRQGVFRPGHNLPTMTIDEYLAEERRRGGIIDGGGPMSGRGPEPDEDDMDQADEETIKARAWDEFTEANPRGSGNTMNRG